MSFAKKLILALAAGAALSAAPAFADSFRGYDRYGYRIYERDYRDYRHDARWHRHSRDRVVVVERPYHSHRTVVVERPVYVERPYYDPPAAPNTLGSIVGAVIDYMDQRQ